MAAVWKEIVFPLDHPIKTDDGTEVTSLTFREPDAEAMEKWEAAGLSTLAEGAKPTIKQAIVLAQSMLSTPDDPMIVRHLHRDDFVKLAEVLTPLAAGSAASAPSTL